MSNETHAWFRRRLPAHAAGLLDESEERRFLEHRAQCEECRQAFDEFTASDEAALTERGAHIPAAMLARWPVARRELTGLERAMVREHLRHCDECRGDLKGAGHTPDLDYVPGLERDVRPIGWRTRLFGKPPRSGAAHDAEPTVDRPPRVGGQVSPPESDRPRRGWVPWALGGWATAATTAAITLAVIPRAPEGDRERAVPSPPTSVTAPAPTPRVSYSLVTLPPTVRLRTPHRGASASATTVLASEDTRFVQLTVGPLDLPQGDRLEAEVRSGDEVLLRRTLVRPRIGGISILFGRQDAALGEGDYRLRLSSPASRATGSARPDTVELEFRIVRRAP